MESEKSFNLIEFLSNQSLLGLVFEPQEIRDCLKKYPPKTSKRDKVLFAENSKASVLYIVISGEIKLFSKREASSSIEMGNVTAGRSANLYSILNGLAFQYEGRITAETRYLAIPWSEIEPVLKRRPALEPYLKAITEDTVFRALAKEMNEIGCSKEFKIELLGSVKSIDLKNNTWVLHQGQITMHAFMVVGGNLQCYQKTENEKITRMFSVPGRSWIAWTACMEQSPSAYSFRTTGQAKILQLTQSRLQELAEAFPEDFETYQNWVKNATQLKEGPEDQEEGEEVDPEKLFQHTADSVKEKKGLYPWVEQENEMDCGPACLAMISKYFENELSIQYWRGQVYTNREGTSIFDLAKSVERNGFEAHGLYLESLEELEAEHLPVIAVRQYHYLVIYEVSKTHVVVGDPGVGIRKMTHEEFHHGFEKAILLLKPTSEFYKIEAASSTYGHYLALFQGYQKELLLILACSSLLVLFSLFPPMLMQVIMDSVLKNKDLKLLWVAVIAMGVIHVFQSGMEWLRSYYISFLTVKFDFRALSAFLRKMFSLPYPFFANRHVGDFTRRISEMERLRDFLTHNALSTFLSLLTIGVYGVVLCFYSPLIAVMTFLFAPLTVAISIAFSKKLQQHYKLAFVSRSEEESLLNDLIRGMSTIKALTSEVAARWRLEEKIVATLKSRHHFSMTASSLMLLTDLYGKLSKLGIMAFAAYLGVKGKMSPGQIVSISVFVSAVIEPFFHLAHAWSGIQETKAAMLRLNDIFLAPSENGGKKGGLQKKALRGEIEFQDVWFRYGGDSTPWILKGVSFKIEPGQKVAIVGPSGSGKSTLASLLLRMLEPTTGQILVDGRDYRDYDLNWLRNQIGIIMQESHLFNGSILENIAFGDPVPNLDKVRECAVMANADGFIEQKAGAYDYVISHGGFGLSGGEKQRISCARAFYLNPSVLILDEATSALDGVAERGLIECLMKASKNRAILSIAHRYTTARHFEQVLLMSSGRVVGFGSHAQMREESELYRTLFGLNEAGEAA